MPNTLRGANVMLSIQVEALKDNANLLAKRIDVDAPAAHAVAVEADLAAINDLKRIDTTQQSALTAAGRTDEADHLVKTDVEVDATQHFYLAKAFEHLIDLEKCHGQRPPWVRD